MGYIKHDAIVVTTGTMEGAQWAIRKAEHLGLQCTSAVSSHANGYVSFLIIPDGSKEGWEASDAAEAARQKWMQWASHEAVSKDKVFVDYAHVRFGGDDDYAAVLNSDS